MLTRRPLALCALAFGAILLLGVSLCAPFDKDQEPQSAEWIQGITERRQLLIPTDDYGAICRKPPLYYWLSAAVADATGGTVDEARARAVSLISAVAIVLIAFSWTAEVMGASAGFLAAAMLLGTYGFASRATLDLTDMLLTCLLFAAWRVLYRLIEIGGARRPTILCGAMIGLAILTKGPVAIVIPALGVAIYLALTRRSPLMPLGRGWSWAAAAIAFGIAALWYAPAALVGGPLFIAVFLSENFGHFMPAAMGGTGEAMRPWWYIAVRMFGAAMPLSLLIPAAILRLADARSAKRRFLLFHASLVLAVLILFSAASAKRDDYILPAMPPLAILFAAVFFDSDSLPCRALAPLLRDIACAIAAAAQVAIVVAALVIARRAGASNPASGLQSADASYLALFISGIRAQTTPFVIFEFASILGAVTISTGIARRRALLTGAGLALIALAGTTLFNGVLRPDLARAQTLKFFAAEVRTKIGDAPLYGAAPGHDFELSYYYGAPVPSAAGLARLTPSDTTVHVVARPRDLPRLTPSVRAALRPVLGSNLIGGGGPPTLYELPARN